MGMISFFKTPKPRQFNYKPVFYDERKEALKEREADIKRELGIKDGNALFVPSIKGRFASFRNASRKSKSKTNIRLLVILIFLTLLFFFLFYY